MVIGVPKIKAESLYVHRLDVCSTSSQSSKSRFPSDIPVVELVDSLPSSTLQPKKKVSI